MNDNKLLWGFLLSFIGTAFGWFLNQITQWIRVRQDDQKNLKQVLYNLLEVYHIFLRSDFGEDAKKMTDKLLSIIPKDQRPDRDVLLNQINTLFIETFIKQELLQEFKGIEDNYQNSIKSLSEIDPLTAFHLSGKTSILELFEKIEGYFNELQQAYPNEEVKKSSKMVIGLIRPDILNEVMSALKKDIIGIAWKINPYTWLKTKKLISNMQNKVAQKSEKLADQYIENVKREMGL